MKVNIFSNFCPHFSDQTMSYEAYNWRGLIEKPNHSKVIHCTNTQEPDGIYINIEGSKEEILLKNTGKYSGKGFKIHKELSYTVPTTPVLTKPIFDCE